MPCCRCYSLQYDLFPSSEERREDSCEYGGYREISREYVDYMQINKEYGKTGRNYHEYVWRISAGKSHICEYLQTNSL